MSWQPDIDELHRRAAIAREMGGPDSVAFHHGRGKLTVRERIDRFVDAGSFAEIPLRARRRDVGRRRHAHVVPPRQHRGRGGPQVDGRTVYVRGGNDFTIRGGSSDAGRRRRERMIEGAAAVSPACRSCWWLDGAGGSVREVAGKANVTGNGDPYGGVHAAALAGAPLVPLREHGVAGRVSVAPTFEPPPAGGSEPRFRRPARARQPAGAGALRGPRPRRSARCRLPRLPSPWSTRSLQRDDEADERALRRRACRSCLAGARHRHPEAGARQLPHPRGADRASCRTSPRTRMTPSRQVRRFLSYLPRERVGGAPRVPCRPTTRTRRDEAAGARRDPAGPPPHLRRAPASSSSVVDCDSTFEIAAALRPLARDDVRARGRLPGRGDRQLQPPRRRRAPRCGREPRVRSASSTSPTPSTCRSSTCATCRAS